MKIKEKQAISLIVLVITVIVLSILAATVIVSISDTDVISETNKTVFKADMANYKEVYEMYVTKETLNDISFDSSSLNLKYGDNELNDIFNNLPDKYKENFAIIEGELAYITDNDTEKEILETLGIKSSDAISKTKSYVGYYADTDGDGEADGFIYADFAFSRTTNCTVQYVSGSSMSTRPETFSYSAKEITELKDYVISKASYSVPVIKAKGSGTNRFYVMAFSDFEVDGKNKFTPSDLETLKLPEGWHITTTTEWGYFYIGKSTYGTGSFATMPYRADGTYVALPNYGDIDFLDYSSVANNSLPVRLSTTF